MTASGRRSITIDGSDYALDPAVDIGELRSALRSALTDGSAVEVAVVDPHGRPLILLVNGRVTPTVVIDPGGARPTENVPKGEISNW